MVWLTNFTNHKSFLFFSFKSEANHAATPCRNSHSTHFQKKIATKLTKKHPGTRERSGRLFCQGKRGHRSLPRAGGCKRYPPPSPLEAKLQPTPGGPKGLTRGCANPRCFGPLPKTQCQPAKRHVRRWMEVLSSKEGLAPAWGSYSQKHCAFFRRKCNFHQRF